MSGNLMYFQMQTHLCTPSRETVSTTYLVRVRVRVRVKGKG